MADIQIAKQSDLDGKANVSHSHNEYASADHNHDDTYQPVGSYADTSHTHAYGDLTSKPTIPSSTNDLSNDSGFITNSYDNTTSGLTATDIQAAIDELKALIDGSGGA
ncbi:hypothetical protein CIL05_06860 [Virgibacillus profundi]|uniref:Uncharacterized protein n=1 Tax=Virgibacillus profundi TaxID=2024555 RepID=A0A2A2IF53_9BACI|nr:hypothetical protein [Virgibacillus profundi]PAV30182.1 hypothetical protein CIL05_06860 [Virgibacillus profundi]PXY54354.1 hypothetical protein CIT14_06945 [Virgibacillus profundi]